MNSKHHYKPNPVLGRAQPFLWAACCGASSTAVSMGFIVLLATVPRSALLSAPKWGSPAVHVATATSVRGATTVRTATNARNVTNATSPMDVGNATTARILRNVANAVNARTDEECGEREDGGEGDE